MGKPRTARPENTHQLQAYEAFQSQPQPRSLKRLAPEIKVPWRTLFDWQRRYRWRERALAHDRKLIDAAAAEADEERTTVRIVRSFYQSIKLLMADFATTQQKRHNEGGPVTPNEAHTGMRILEMLEKNYSDILEQAADPEP